MGGKFRAGASIDKQRNEIAHQRSTRTGWRQVERWLNASRLIDEHHNSRFFPVGSGRYGEAALHLRQEGCKTKRTLGTPARVLFVVDIDPRDGSVDGSITLGAVTNGGRIVTWAEDRRADIRQAEIFHSLLAEQRAELCDRLDEQATKLARYEQNHDTDGSRRKQLRLKQIGAEIRDVDRMMHALRSRLLGARPEAGN